MNVLNIEPGALRHPDDIPHRTKLRPIPIDLAAERAKARAYRKSRARISYVRLAAAIALALAIGLPAGLTIAWGIDRAIAPEWAE